MTDAKTNCFAYRMMGGKPQCNVLLEMVCAKKGTCSFFKTRAQFEADLMKANGTSSLRDIIGHRGK